jgi:hypothetical protein
LRFPFVVAAHRLRRLPSSALKRFASRSFSETLGAEDSAGFPGIGLSAHPAKAFFVHDPDAVSIAAEDALREIGLFALGSGLGCGGFQRTAATVTEKAFLQNFGPARGAGPVP